MAVCRKTTWAPGHRTALTVSPRAARTWKRSGGKFYWARARRVARTTTLDPPPRDTAQSGPLRPPSEKNATAERECRDFLVAVFRSKPPKAPQNNAWRGGCELVGVGPNLGRNRSNLACSGTTRPKLGRNRPRFGHSCPEHRWERTKFGPIRGRFGRVRTTFGRNQKHAGRCRSSSGTT